MVTNTGKTYLVHREFQKFIFKTRSVSQPFLNGETNTPSIGKCKSSHFSNTQSGLFIILSTILCIFCSFIFGLSGGKFNKNPSVLNEKEVNHVIDEITSFLKQDFRKLVTETIEPLVKTKNNIAVY